jgi:hypothetical protein
MGASLVMGDFFVHAARRETAADSPVKGDILAARKQKSFSQARQEWDNCGPKAPLKTV